MHRCHLKALLQHMILCLGFAQAAHAQLDENCSVAVLNRTAQVRADGSWSIDNIPSTFGPVRARATCVQNGATRLLQSNLFVMSVGGVTGISANIASGAPTPVPTLVTVTAPATKLTQPNQTIALEVTGIYADNTTRDLTRASAGTTYVISNTDLAAIGADGTVTAKASGTVFVQASNEGAQGLFKLGIVLSGDTDGDGIPDDEEVRLGLDPNNPADALDDPDHDGLTNVEEVRAGTDIHNPDTDGDGLTDGREVKVLHTNPLLKDTDGDGVPDNIEVATGSDPLNPASFNLQSALSGIRVTPASFLIDTNSINGSGFQQLVVTGDFKLGGTINLTAKSKGTSYTSSSQQVCGFGAEDGRVLGLSDGSCVISVANSGFLKTVTATVSSFSPKAFSKLDLPGYPNGVVAQGNFAYIAAGASGLVVADISDPAKPRIVATLDTPGNADEVRIVGNFVYLADGPGGLQIINVSNPLAPVIAGALGSNDALDIMVFDNRAYVADRRSGLRIIDVSDAANPTLLKDVPSLLDASGQGIARAVDILQGPDNKLYAILAEGGSGPTPGFSGAVVIDVTDVNSAAIVSNLPLLGPPRDLRVAGKFAYAVSRGGVQTIDLTNPLAPALQGSLSGRLVPKDIEVAGNAAILADQNIPSAVPIVDISDPLRPVPKSEVDFISFGEGLSGTGIAVKGAFVYLVASFFGNFQDEKGTTGGNLPGTAALFTGQYLSDKDSLGIAPQVALASPVGNSSVLGGSTISLRANATDDRLVDSVTFQVNGTDVFTDDAIPYEALFTVPSNATTLTVSARAKDFGGNVGTAAPVTLTVISDPLTTVVGSVTGLADGTTFPVAGAAVVCLDVTGISEADSTFRLPGVPTTEGLISCNATFTRTGRVLQGKSFKPVRPVPGGITSVADVIIR